MELKNKFKEDVFRQEDVDCALVIVYADSGAKEPLAP